MHLLRTLGSLDLRAPDNTPVAALLQQPRRMALLAFLAASGPGAMVRRDRLLLLFWPDLDESRGRAALSQALHVLRRSLGADAIVTRGNEEVGLDPSAFGADVTRFLAAAGRQDWAEADRLYAGEFLPGFHLGGAPEFGQWLDAARGHLRHLAGQAATALARRAADAGDAAGAVRWTRRAIEHDPLDETLLRALLSRLAAAGDRTGVARAYEEYAARLARELELEPSPETVQLRDAMLGGAAAGQAGVPASARPVAPDPSPDAAAAPGRPVAAWRRRGLWIGGLLLALLLGLGSWQWHARRRGARATNAPALDRILVLPFAVRGDSSLDYLHEGMVDLLGSRLEAYGVLRVVDPVQVLGHLAEDDSAGRIPTPKPALAQALAERYDASLYLTGSVMRLGTVIEISAVLHDRAGEPRATVSRQAASESDLGQAADGIVRALLGRRWSRPADRLLQLAVVETPSPEALRAFLAGERAFRQGDYTGARAQFAAATEADTLFALAFYRLSVVGGWLADGETYLQAAERAAALADRLSSRDAKLMRAHLAYVRSQVDESERLYREIVTQYPDDAEAWYNLGELLFHQNPRRGRSMGEARQPFERAAGLLGPTPESAQHLLALRLMDGERTSLLPVFDSLLLILPPASPRRVSYDILRAIASGSDQEVGRALAGMRGRDPNEVIIAAWAVSNYTDRFSLLDSILAPITTAATQAPTRAAALGLMAHAAAARGDGAALRRALDRLAGIDHATALETRAWLLAQPWVEGSREERSALRAALAAQPREPYLPAPTHFVPTRQTQPSLRLFLGALLALRDADTVAAEKALARLRMGDAATGGPALAGSLHAELVLARGRPDVALAELDRHTAIPLPDMPQFGAVRERLLRARALAGVGRYEEAVGWFESCRTIFTYDFAWRPASRAALRLAAIAAGDTLAARFKAPGQTP